MHSLSWKKFALMRRRHWPWRLHTRLLHYCGLRRVFDGMRSWNILCGVKLGSDPRVRGSSTPVWTAHFLNQSVSWNILRGVYTSSAAPAEALGSTQHPGEGSDLTSEEIQ